MRINREILTKLKENHLGLESYMILYAKHYKKSWLVHWKPAEYIYDQLHKKGFLTKNRSLSSAGSKFMESLKTEKEKAEREKMEKGFKEFFFEVWPKDDKFAHFPFSRQLRIKKEDSFREYEKVIKSGITHTQLLDALKAQIKASQNESMRQSKNQLKWLPSPQKWLAEGRYESFLNKVEESRVIHVPNNIG